MRWAMVLVLCLPAVARGELVWGLGLKTSAQLSGAAGGDMETSMIGGGVQARFRFGPRWGLDVALEAMRGRAAGGAYERRSTPLTVSGTYRFDLGGVDLYLLLGVGGMTDEVEYRDSSGATVREEVDQGQFHLGVGIEGRVGRFGLGAELRGLVRFRDEDDRASAYDAVPRSEGGAQVGLAGTYYF